MLRPSSAVAERPSVSVTLRRWSVRTAIAWVALVIAAVLAVPAQASSGGRINGQSLPSNKAVGVSLTYDTFTSATCSQNGFSTTAIARMAIPGHVRVSGTTLLDGAPYDTFAEDLEFGPATFDTKFVRPREGDPPFGAASSSYTFVFNANVYSDDLYVGTVFTTVTCTNGAFSAFSEFAPSPPGVPVGHPASWAALALLLAAIAASRLTRRRA